MSEAQIKGLQERVAYCEAKAEANSGSWVGEYFQAMADIARAKLGN